MAARLEGEEEERAFVKAKKGNGTRETRQEGYVQNCVAALGGTSDTPPGGLFVVGDAFLKSWYTVFNYQDASAGGRPSVSFAQAV